LLAAKGENVEVLEEFVERDVDNILELVSTLNSGTHGNAGKFGLSKLLAIKTRAEQGIQFMARSVNGLLPES